MNVAALHRSEVEHGLTEHELLQVRTNEVRFVYVPYRRYLTVDGQDEPGGPSFRRAIAALYPVAYALHFALKARGVVAPVGSLEGTYWIGSRGPMPAEAFSRRGTAERMDWRLMIAIPDQATDDEIAGAMIAVEAKSGTAATGLLRWDGWLEGECAQTLHVGDYDAEGPTIARLNDAITGAGFRPRGCHHEIYLSGPSTAPERTRTIIRQPIEEAEWWTDNG